MNDDRYQYGGRKGDGREASLVEERLRFVEPQAEPDEPAKRGETGEI